MADVLPKSIVIRMSYAIKVYYADYNYESDKGAGYVSCKSESVHDPLAKIEVEKAKIDSKYVHMRFSHTNKYWARRGPGTDDYWILATSDQPEEDTSKLSCTLFEPVVRDDGYLFLTHVQSGGAVKVDFTTLNQGIYASPGVSPSSFRFIDWDTLVKLPKRVVFKGDNDKYLKAFKTNDGYPHLQFGSKDGNDVYSPQEVLWYNDGHVRIKCDYFGKLWRCNVQNWILANAEDDLYNKLDEALFWPIKIDSSTIALRAKQNNQFCKRLWIEQRTADCLSASTGIIDKYAKLVVEELVTERSIYNVKYRMEDARIYDERPFVAATGSADNDSDTESTMSIRVQYEKKKSYSFSRGFSLSMGVATTIQAGIPLIAGGEIEVSVETTTELNWDTSTEETETVEGTYTATVPPRSRVTVDVVATIGKCSVPFSYTQKDKSSTDGQFVTSQHIDGIFNGVNYYNFHFTQPTVRKIDVP